MQFRIPLEAGLRLPQVVRIQDRWWVLLPGKRSELSSFT
jgi:hypothetical protein